MKWLGQYIQSFTARFRHDVYLENISSGTIASGGNLGLDSNNKIVKANEASGDLTAITAGTGLSGTNLTGPIPTLNVDASIPEITTLAGLTSFGAAGATTDIAAGDITMYNAVDDGNPTISLGSSATNRLEIKSTYNSGAQTLDEVVFTNYTTSSTTNDGRFKFYVDEVLMMNIADTAVSVYGGVNSVDDGAQFYASDSTASSATQGGKLILQSDDGAAMGDDHRLGVIEFKGAEDASNNRTIGARIEGMCDAAWSASENGARLDFYTTDGNASESKVLTLDSDKLATFTGNVALNTITSGTWNGAVIASAYLDADTAHLSGIQTFTGSKTFSSTAAPQVIIDGNITANPPGDGSALHIDSADVTDGGTSASGTADIYAHVNIENPRLLATNASVTTSDATTLYIKGAPAASTNQTISRAWSMWVDAGNARFDGSIYSGTAEVINSAGIIQIASQPSITTLAGVSAIGSAGTDITITSDTVNFTSANADDPAIWIKNTANDNQATRMLFLKERGADGQDGDECGSIYFYSYDDGTPSLQKYGYIESTIHDATSGQESGKLDIGVANHDGGAEPGVSMQGGSANGEVDVTIGSGSDSLTTIAGDLGVTTGLILDSVDVTAIQTASESFADNDTSLMTSAAINDRINRPSGQMFIKNFNFSVNAGTTEYYFPMASTAESTSSVNQAVTMIMPTAGKLLKIHLRTSVNHSGQTTTFTLYNWDTDENWNNGNKSVLGVQSGTGPGIGEVVTYDFTSSLDSGTNAFTANEMIAVSFQNGGDPGSNTKYVATLVFDLDWTSY